MCLFDEADDIAVILHSNKRTAAKEHTCSECYGIISKGENYIHEGVLCDGSIDTFKVCCECECKRNWLANECGGWCYGAVIEDYLDHDAELQP